MKRTLIGLCVFGLFLVSSTAFAQVVNITNAGSGPYTTIQAAINNAATVNGDIIQVNGGTYTANEAIVVNKGVTIQGVTTTPTITPPGGSVGITVAANNVILKNLTVTGATGGLTKHGIWVNGYSGLTIQNVSATNNAGSGIALRNVSSTTVTSVSASNNSSHGLEIGNGSTNVEVNGGTFSNNGTGGNQSTGGGIMIYADASALTNGTSIVGTVTANGNSTAGIYLFCDASGHIDNTTIGSTGTITLNDNGTSGSGGAAVLVYGPCDITQITANSTRSVGWQTAGLVVVGTDAAGDNSPTNTTATNCTLSGFNSTSPAGTMWVTNGSNTLRCKNDVNAYGTPYNTINGIGTGSISLPADGYTVEDLLYHKTDDNLCGRFKGPGTTVYVTQNSGSITRGIACADGATYTTVQVQGGATAYAENVVVDKSITLSGDGATTIIKPSSGNGVAVTASSGVTVKNLKIYLSSPVSVAGAPTFSNNTFTFKVPLIVLLQGAYSSGTMRTDLATNNLIPPTQPYNTSPFDVNSQFQYDGTEHVSSQQVFIDNNIVDWILVELRNISNVTVSRAAALLTNNGTVEDADLSTGVTLSEALTSGYTLSNSIVIKHRNHLAIMSHDPLTLPYATAYSFTTAQAQAYGTNPMALLTTGVYGAIAGDANADGQVNADDRTATWNSRNLVGYRLDDVTLDGQTNADDRTVTWNNRNLTVQIP